MSIFELSSVANHSIICLSKNDKRHVIDVPLVTGNSAYIWTTPNASPLVSKAIFNRIVSKLNKGE